MSVSIPAPLAETIGRVAAPPDVESAPPDDITGTLADLWSWWQRVGAGQPLRPTWVTCAGGAVEDAVLSGLGYADSAADSGATLIVPRIDVRDDASARALVALLTRREASAVLGQPEGMADSAWMAACADIRDRMADIAGFRGEPLRLLEALGAGSIACMVGLLIGAAARRTPVLVDGTDELAAALVADRLGFRAKAWWRAGSTSPDPARAAAVDRIDLDPGLPLDLSDDAGQGAKATEHLLSLVLDGR